MISILGFDSKNINSNSSPNIFLFNYDNKFFTGVLDNGRNRVGYGSDSLYAQSIGLELNIWHAYSGPGYGWPGIWNDVASVNVSDYSAAITQRVDSNYVHQMTTLMDRPKFEYLAFGQRSDYQCDTVSVNPATPYWFYSYNTHNVGSSIPDSGAQVVHCAVGNGQGWIVKNLRANREQCNYQWNPWANDNTYDWYILPRIRINSSEDTSKKVCKIEVVNWKDSILKTLVLKAANFRDSSGNYNGQYLLEYFNKPNAPIDQKLNATSAFNPDNNFFASWWDTTCHVDFRIYYYNECEMWIDYLRVENTPAHELLTLPSRSNFPDSSKIKWLDDEIDLFSGIFNGPYKFYVEEFEFNTLPCIEYINKHVKNRSGSKLTFMVNYNNDLMQAHQPDYWNQPTYRFSPQQISNYLIEKTGITEIFNGAYCFEGWKNTDGPPISKHPNSILPISYDTSKGILSYAVSPSEYDSWLQNRIDTNSYGTGLTFMLKQNNNIIKTSYCTSNNVSFKFLEQGHLWKSPGHKLKEPSNEEINLMANLALSYGSKGNILFWMGSFNNFDSNTYGMGMTKFNGNRRDSNVYGQNKWSTVASLNHRLQKWGPYLMSFNNASTNSYIYHSEQSSMSSETFINDIKTYKNSDISDNSNSIDEETTSNRYLQASVFNNDSVDTRYFMIVNRRCSPIVATYPDGQRKIQVKFNANSSSFANFNNWKIIDLEADTSVATFDKTVSSYVDLGWFNPGQGKLYKVVPVMKVGGTFAGNEFIQNMTFDCNGTVYTNGHNLTLNEGVNISFADSVQIIMSDGKFASGVSGRTRYTNLTAQSGRRWLGIKFDGTSINMNLTRISGVRKKNSDNHEYTLYALNPDTLNITYSRITPIASEDSSASGVL
ncbi:MAG: hypothetical protein JST55_15590, partial [Bacteroidetes bacterium]|nr:hypothetical protein [Bacteroidota bacterium]